jgi:hypothetical protein
LKGLKKNLVNQVSYSRLQDEFVVAVAAAAAVLLLLYYRSQKVKRRGKY